MENKKCDGYIGSFISCYLGHSAEKEIRWKASSGGLVSSVLIFALKEGIIDGALVTRMSGTSPLEPEVFVAQSKDEVLSAQGSKYCPVLVNQVIRATKKMIRQRGKYAVVGLPCHIRAIRKAESLNKKLKDRILLHIGLFCSHTVSFSGTEVLLKRMGVRPEDVLQLRYRGGGWPGNMLIKLRGGRTRAIPYFDYWAPLFAPFFFTPTGCMVCSDATNELADISFGDAWLPEIKKKDRVGTSVVISRTSIGEELLRRMRSKGVVELDEIGEEDVARSQLASLVFKKKSLMERMLILNLQRRASTKTSALGYACALTQLFNLHVSRRRFFPALIEHIPLQILRAYYLVVMGLHYLCWKMS